MLLAQGQRLALRQLGGSDKHAYLLPIPTHDRASDTRFSLLTDHMIDGHDGLEVLFCNVYPLQMGNTAAILSMDLNNSGDPSGPTRLACKNAATDSIILPASDQYSQHPFDERKPFSYLQYHLKDIAEHQYIAVVDKSFAPTQGWVIAEFSSFSDAVRNPNVDIRQLFEKDIVIDFPASRTLVTDIQMPALASSLLAYNLKLQKTSGATSHDDLFTPLVRQHVSDNYESKYFVNAHDVEINVHGAAPYLPPALRTRHDEQGLSLQIWADPTVNEPLRVTVSLDIFGSLGKLWMRYRTLFATFPLFVVALVMRHQFRVYDTTGKLHFYSEATVFILICTAGIFMSFSESLDQSLRTSIPLVLGSLCLLAAYTVRPDLTASPTLSHLASATASHRSNATESIIDFTKNDMLLGSLDYYFWILLPLFGVIAAGLSIALNYTVLGLTYVITVVYTKLKPTVLKGEDAR